MSQVLISGTALHLKLPFHWRMPSLILSRLATGSPAETKCGETSYASRCPHWRMPSLRPGGVPDGTSHASRFIRKPSDIFHDVRIASFHQPMLHCDWCPERMPCLWVRPRQPWWLCACHACPSRRWCRNSIWLCSRCGFCVSQPPPAHGAAEWVWCFPQLMPQHTVLG